MNTSRRPMLLTASEDEYLKKRAGIFARKWRDPAADGDDYYQHFRRHCNAALSGYRKSKATRMQLIAGVVRKLEASLIREFTAQKRDIKRVTALSSLGAKDEDGAHVDLELAEPKTPDHLRKLAVEEFLESLTERQQEVSRLLMGGFGMTEIGRIVKVKTGALYRELKRIKKHAIEHSFEDFL